MKKTDQILLQETYSMLLEKRSSVPLISIDVQPAHKDHCDKIIDRYVSFLNDYSGPIVCFFNGVDAGFNDTTQSLIEYYVENGLTEEALSKIEFKEKYYAFFRNWMDKGVERKYLIKAIRFLVLNKETDSRDILPNQWKELYGSDYECLKSVIESEDSIHIPHINIAELKQFGGCYLCGGGKNECLSEFRLILESFNIKYKIIQSLVY